MISTDPSPSMESTSPHGGPEGLSPRRRRSSPARRGAGPDVFAALEVLRAAGFSLLVAGYRSVQWLSVADVAARLSVSPITVRRMIDRGELGRVLRWSSEIRIRAADVEAWEVSHTSGVSVEHEERKA